MIFRPIDETLQFFQAVGDLENDRRGLVIVRLKTG